MAVVVRRAQAVAESVCDADQGDDNVTHFQYSASWVLASILAAGSCWWCCRRQRRAPAQIAIRTLDLPSGLRVRLP